MITAADIAKALGGVISGRDSALVPGPGHSPRDRSLSVKVIDGNEFIVHSFAGDTWQDCAAHVRGRVGHAPEPFCKRIARPNNKTEARTADNNRDFAMRLWREARDPRGTIVERYLNGRGLELADDLDAIRFHPRLRLDVGDFVPGMISLLRDIKSNAPTAIQQTFLTDDGAKIGRKNLGPMKGCAIKLDPDEHVTTGLHVSEGFETALAARLAGFKPVWALGSSGGISALPVLAGIDAVVVLGEVNDHGANERAAQKCAERWIAAGQEVLVVIPKLGNDLAAAWQSVSEF